MDFSAALQQVKRGAEVARMGWNGKRAGADMYVYLEDSPTDTTLPFLVLHTADDEDVPWLASQTDLLAEDWVLTCKP